jgi:hypothetical protein
MTQAPFQPGIVRQGQPYYDERVYADPKPVAVAVARAFGRPPPRIVLGFNRVPLIWKKK